MRMTKTAAALLVAAGLTLVLGAGCKKDEPSPTPASGKTPVATTGEPGGNAATLPTPGKPATAPARPERVEPPAKLKLSTGVASPVERDGGKLTASSVETRAGHVYVAAAFPEAMPRWRWQPTRVEVKGPAHGVGLADSEAERFIVRVVGDQVPETLTLTVYSRQQRRERGVVKPWEKREYTIATTGITPTAGPETGGLRAAFFSTLARSMDIEGGRSPFFGFVKGRARRLAGETELPDRRPRRDARSEIGDLMSLYTGMTSIEEALQVDRGLWLRRQGGEATVALDSITGVPLPAHPWDKMMAGKKPNMEPLASVIPADTLYVHFHDLRTAVKIAREVDEWMSPLAQTLEWRAGSSHLISRYEESLVIERTGLAETLGHLAASGVALVVGDPFVRDGTDVALVFKVDNASILKTALGRYEESARKRHGELTEEKYTIDGVEVRRLFTKDGRANQHRAEFDGVVVVANSRASIERLLATRAGRTRSLAQSGDFRYMRTVYPYDEKTEDGFVFISDAFVTAAVGPRARILQARRMRAQADLMAVGNAALLYGWLEGKAAEDTKALLSAGYLTETELAHADGGAITLDPATGPSSAAWGRPAALKPLAELAIDKVTEAEKGAYEEFQRNYQRYWRQFIDPVAIRLTRSADGKTLTADARMLPLIDATDYDELIETVGKTRVTPPQVAGGIQWTVGVGRDAKLRRELDGIGKMMGKKLEFGWLGDWAMVGSLSSGALWDFMLMAGEMPQVGASTERRRDRDMMSAASRLPVYAGVHVANPLMLAATLSTIKALVESAAPGMVDWAPGEAYREVPVVTIKARLPGDGTLQAHYATAKDVFLVSPDRTTLEMLIDDVMDGRVAQSAKDDDAAAAQAILSVAPGGPGTWLTRTTLGLIENESVAQANVAIRQMEVLYRGLRALPTGDALRDAGVGFLGFEPGSPQGGSFSLVDGHVTHTLYGSEVAPAVQNVPVADAPVTAVLGALENLQMGLSFEGEGETRGLRATLRLSRK